MIAYITHPWWTCDFKIPCDGLPRLLCNVSELEQVFGPDWRNGGWVENSGMYGAHDVAFMT